MNNTSTYDSVYQVKLAQIAALQGDTTKKYDSVYQTELEILKKLEEGGMGAQIDDTEVSTGTVWSSYKTLEEVSAATAGDYASFTVGQAWTQHDADEMSRLYRTYGDKMFNHIFIKSDQSDLYYRCHTYAGGSMLYIEVIGGLIYATFLNDNIEPGGTLNILVRYEYKNTT